MTGRETLIWLLSWLVGGEMSLFVIGIFPVLVLHPRWSRLPRVMPAVLLTAAGTLSTMGRSLTRGDPQLFHFFEVVNVLLIVGTILVMFRDGLPKKLLCLALNACGMVVAQIITLFLAEKMGLQYQENFHNWDMFAILVMNLSISMVIYGLLALVWNRAARQETFRKRNILFLLFPISQMMEMWYIGHMPVPNQSEPLAVGGIVVGLLGQLALFYIVFMQTRQDAMEKKLAEVNTAWRLEKQNYDALEKRRDRIEKIRHDMNNQLTTALFLLKQNDTRQAREILEGVRGEIGQTDILLLCENPVVNAVMTEKAGECRQEGIHLESELSLPADLGIQPIYLCSSFSNLMDNAIRAAMQCPPENRSIKIKAVCRGDYLHIKAVNTAMPPEKKPRREGHGYGLVILQDIAQRHNGEFSGSWADGVFTAMLTLEITSAAPAEAQPVH